MDEVDGLPELPAKKGKRASKVQIEERVDAAEELLCSGIGSGTAERQLAKRYDITTRMARNYIAKVYERWKEQTKEDAPHRREKLIRTTERFFAKAMHAKQWGPAASALNLLARLSGANTDQESREHLLRQLGPAPTDPAQMALYAQRCLVIALNEVITNKSLDPERRLRYIAEIGSKIGSQHVKALTGARVEQLEAQLAELAPVDPAQVVDDETEDALQEFAQRLSASVGLPHNGNGTNGSNGHGP